MEKETIRNNFIRQRRNLIAVSLIVTFAEITGIKITEINLLGNKVELQNQEYVYLALWLALIYWLVRYYQYFRALGDKGFKKEFYIRINNLASKVAFKQFLRDSPSDKLKDKKYFLQSANILYRSLKYYKFNLRVVLGIREGENQGSGVVSSHIIIVNRFKLIIPSVRAASHVFLNTPLFSEYVLPYLFVSVPFTIRFYHFMLSSSA